VPFQLEKGEKVKQEILCPKCTVEMKVLFERNPPPTGEGVKFVSGAALREYRCDSCGHDIDQSSECTVFSIWSDYGRIPYYAWESEFIKERKK
jgi:rubredoxin